MKEAITLEDIIINNELFNNCRVFYANLLSIKEFGNYSNCNVFMYLFGKDEGTRLWFCFVKDANRNIYKFFFEYLNSQQISILVGNILCNEDLKMSAF